MIKLARKIYQLLNPNYQTLFLDYKVQMQPRYGWGKPAHSLLYDIINQYRAEYVKLLQNALYYSSFICDIQDGKVESDVRKPVWNNGFLPGLDMVTLYTVVSEFKPSRFVEIGSGNSTKVVYKAKKEQQLNTKIISLDPKPRAEIDKLADEIIRFPLENTALDFISGLKENDILFVDNSHRIFPNSDSMVFFLEILPYLNKGVIVHLHDIYLPYDYPRFMCKRAYSEQYGLACYLIANPHKYIPILPNFFISEDKELSRVLTPLWEHKNLHGVERHGGSFWIKIGA